MKRVIVSLMVVVGALGSACTEAEESLPAAGLSGTYDVVLVKDPERTEAGDPVQGDLLFVTSTDRNELRVLDLKQQGTERGYLRAPNPLEALSIPVLERPQALARDVSYDANGQEVSGPYVYARSNGSTRISVVAADRTLLREVTRLVTNELTPPAGVAPSAGPVTAFAARGPEQKDGPSTLYYATQDPNGARVWRVVIPGPQAFGQGAALVPEQLPNLVLPANVSVSSILVLPQAGQLVVATRGLLGTVGKTYKVNLLQNGTVTELNFGGQQVIQLATHERVEGDVPLNAGERIFGVLDPSNCGAGAPQCTSGLLAVSAETGAVLNDATNHPMLPLAPGPGLPMGLSLSTNTKLLFQQGAARSVETMPLLGIVPLSSGDIYLFDGVGLRPFDVNTDAAAATVSFATAQGATTQTGDITVEVTNGVTTAATYVLTYQGTLPGMDSLERDPASPTFELPATLREGRGQVVQPGDILVLFPEGVGVQPCATDLVVATVQTPPAADQPSVLTTTAAIPEACAGFTRFQVRAAGSQPLVLSSSSEGYIQRLGPSQSFTRTGRYFFHPDDYTGAAEGVAVRLTVSSQLSAGIARGDRYVVGLSSNFFPFTVTLDTTIRELQPFVLPGPVVQAEVGDTDYAYIAYPSADGVLQVNLQTVFADVANSRGVFPFQ